MRLLKALAAAINGASDTGGLTITNRPIGNDRCRLGTCNHTDCMRRRAGLRV